MSISSPFIRRPIGTSLLMAAIFLVGLAAFPLLPVAPLPQVDFPTIAVSAKYPGASPETMAEDVAQPLETEFSQIPGVSQLTSVNVLGESQITVQFNLDRNIDAAATDVLEAINAASGQLPKDLPSQPTFRKINPADAPVLILAVQSDALPLTKVDQYAENILAQQISQVHGVGQVLVGGAATPAVRVQVDPGRLASMGLTMEDVRTALVAATSNAPKGTLDGPRQSFTITDNDQLLHARPYNSVIVAYRNGAPVRISDIGAAVRGPVNDQVAGWQNGKPGVILLVFKEPGANVVSTVDAVKAELPRLRASIPPSVHVEVNSDRTTVIRASLDDVEFTLAISVALVVMVIFLFLRSLWATIIPSVTVPVALVGTCAIMYVLGFSLDNLSLMGLTIAVGFVVDDAIVMLENIYRQVEDGMEPTEAALKGAGEIGFTIVSISLSLIAVFIPLLLMGGIVGRLFREFAITVSATVIISAVVSLTLTPMMCARFLHKPARGHGRVFLLVERGFDAVIAGYARTLDVALRFRLVTLGVFLGTLALTAFLFITIPKGFFPTEDIGLITAVTVAGQDVSFAEMSRKQQEVDRLVGADPAVADYASTIGAGTAGQTANNGRIFITLKPFGVRHDSAEQVIARLRRESQAIEGIKLFMQPAQDVRVGGRASRTMFQYTLEDVDGAVLNHWAPQILAKMQKLPMLRDVTTDQQVNGATETLTIDRDAAARYGITPAAIDNTLYDAFGQREVAQYSTQLASYFVVLEVPPKLAGDPATLGRLYVRGSGGQVVPLSAVVHETSLPVTPLAVNHQSQFPAVTISFNLAPGAALGDAVTAIGKLEAGMGTPLSLQGTFQGTAQAFQSSLSSEPLLILAAVLSVYVILGVLYESYVLPLTILSTLPSAGIGALLALRLAGLDLSVIAMIGIILLIGIVKKNGIMMVDFAINAERREGLAPLAAIRQACLLRFRPILMTTMAALLSGLPLMLEGGAGAELRRPLGVAMVGGLLLSQLLTLYTTPVVYLYLDRLQQALRPRRDRRLSRLAERMNAPAE